MSRPTSHFYEFGPFRVDPFKRLLLRDGEHVPITPKAFDTLLAFIDSNGEVLEKDKLMKKLWPDTAVEEHNLTVNISQLRKALGNDPNQQQYIQTLPKRGYRFVADVKESLEECAGLEQSGAAIIHQTQSEATDREQSNLHQYAATRASVAVGAAGSQSRFGARSIRFIASVALIAVAMTVVVLLLKSKTSLPPLRAVPFTSYQGIERQPVFSPDGSYLAFVWKGERGDNLDIYVKAVDGGTPARLTTDPASDSSPAWSPDGRRIAFLRRSKEDSGIYETTLPGGPERKVADFRPGPSYLLGRRLDWSPDGKQLAVAERIGSSNQQAIFLVSIETGEERQLTTLGADDTGDDEPSFSPDGRQLAFVREGHYLVREIFMVSLAGGETRRVTFEKKMVLSIAWTADGREIVFSSDPSGNYSLWRIPIAAGEPVPLAGTSAFSSGWANHISDLTISRRGNRIAYTQWFIDTNIYRIEAPTSSGQSAPPVRLIASTQWDSSAQYSPDGKSIAFGSERSGSGEIWTCASDGSNAIQLTYFGVPETGSPHWSPDGKYIVIDSRIGGNADIYVIKSTGGPPRRLTTESSEDNTPYWSPDGRWIYFSSKRSGDWQIWKIPAEGGPAVQMTHQVGFGPVPSPDGKFVYYAKGQDMNVGLWRIAADGSREEAVPGFNRQTWWCFAVTDGGIYFVDTPTDQHPTVEFFDFKTRQYKTIVTMEGRVAAGMGVSPDGHWIFYTKFDRDDSDIMMAENFQ